MEDIVNRYRWTVLIFLFWVGGRQEVLGLDCFRVYESVDCGNSSTSLDMSSYNYSLPGFNSSSCCDTNKEVRKGTKGKTSSTNSATSNHYGVTLDDCQLKCDTHRKPGYSCWGYNYNYNIYGVTGLCQLINVDTPVSLVDEDDSLTECFTALITYYRLQYCCAEFEIRPELEISGTPIATTYLSDVNTTLCKLACVASEADTTNNICWGFIQRDNRTCELHFLQNSAWYENNTVSADAHKTIYVRKGVCGDVSIVPSVIENDGKTRQIDYERMTSDEREVVIAERIEKIKQALSVNRTSLSAYIRKKTSANDKRTSATAIGMSLGVAVLVITFGIIIISDLRILLQHIQIFYRNIRTVILM